MTQEPLIPPYQHPYLTLGMAAAENWHWLATTFAREVCYSKEERALRFLEEAIELAQAAGVSVDKAQALTDRAYSRPPGDPRQEFGDALSTLLVLGVRFKIDPTHQLSQTLARNRANAQTIAAKWRDKIVADDLQELHRIAQNNSNNAPTSS